MSQECDEVPNPANGPDNPISVCFYVIARDGSGVAGEGGLSFMATSKKLRIVQIDVFTDCPLTGNALAVCLDGRELTTEQMQAIARETQELTQSSLVLGHANLVLIPKGVIQNQ